MFWLKDQLIKVKDGFSYFFEELRDTFTASSLILIGACVLVGTVVTLLAIRFQYGIDIPYIHIVGKDDLQQWGQLGDFFGGILNPLLSFVALLAVLYNIRIQSEELAETRKEAKTTNRIQQQQAKTFERQAFDSTFFGLLDAHANILRDIRLNVQGELREGREVFEFIYQEVIADQRYKALLLYPQNKDDNAQQLFREYCEKYQAIMGHYFRNIYHLLKVIDSADVFHDKSDLDNSLKIKDQKRRDAAILRSFKKEYFLRRQYSNLLRAQLSRYEIALLFMNCLTEDGQGLKPYVELYSNA